MRFVASARVGQVLNANLLKVRVFSREAQRLQTLRSTPEGSGWINVEQVSWPEWPGACREGECFAAVRRLREINRTATSGGCPNITNALTQRGPHRARNASNANAHQHHKHHTTQCRPAATRTGARQRRRATPSRRRRRRAPELSQCRRRRGPRPRPPSLRRRQPGK